jgi:hypothetical protein
LEIEGIGMGGNGLGARLLFVPLRSVYFRSLPYPSVPSYTSLPRLDGERENENVNDT